MTRKQAAGLLSGAGLAALAGAGIVLSGDASARDGVTEGTRAEILSAVRGVRSAGTDLKAAHLAADTLDQAVRTATDDLAAARNDTERDTALEALQTARQALPAAKAAVEAASLADAVATQRQRSAEAQFDLEGAPR